MTFQVESQKAVIFTGIINFNILNTDVENSNPLNTCLNTGTGSNSNTLSKCLQLPEHWYWKTLNHACHHNLATNQWLSLYPSKLTIFQFWCNTCRWFWKVSDTTSCTEVLKNKMLPRMTGWKTWSDCCLDRSTLNNLQYLNDGVNSMGMAENFIQDVNLLYGGIWFIMIKACNSREIKNTGNSPSNSAHTWKWTVHYHSLWAAEFNPIIFLYDSQFPPKHQTRESQ